MRDPADRQRPSQAREALASVSLPKGGGAIRGIGEKFSVNAVSGTASLSVPLVFSPGRAEKADKDADTPTIAQFDTLGRTLLTIADNGKDTNGNDQKFRTRTVLDIEGNQREVIDALDRVVMRYDYDMLGTRIHHASMEAGERFMLNDVMGKPVRAWNSRKYVFRTEYDALRRIMKSFVQGGDPSEPHPKVFAQEVLFERSIYGDSPDTSLTELQQKQANLRGKTFRHFDGAGSSRQIFTISKATLCAVHANSTAIELLTVY